MEEKFNQLEKKFNRVRNWLIVSLVAWAITCTWTIILWVGLRQMMDLVMLGIKY